MRYRAYILGYEPKLHLTRSQMEKLIREADFCIDAPEGIPIGFEIKSTRTIFEGEKNEKMKHLKDGPTSLRCVAHEHGGKIVVLEG